MRSIGFVAAAVIAALLVAGCGSTSHQAAPPAPTTNSSGPGPTSVTSVTARGSTTTLAPPTAAATSTAPPATATPSTAATTTAIPPTAPPATSVSTTAPAAPTSPPTTTASTGVQLPIAAESDSQMKAEGNDGPSSSILLPTSCRQTGTTVTAEGTYTNNGFVPNVYNRYGDVIVLYAFAAPSSGYPQGTQLAASGVSASPVVGSSAPWHVSLSVSPTAGTPARCVVAAQPTHAAQLAP